MFKLQRIRDPLHNLIEFRADQFENALWEVIQSRPFQRLRRIKQLGFSDLVYPGATHSRFAHSVGVFHTARQLMGKIREHLGENGYEDAQARQALAAALVHDLGHGPFSHAFEDVGRRLKLKMMADHEHVSDALIRDSGVAEALTTLGSGFANDVADIIKKGGPGHLYGAVVSSQFDADRLDYMRRDRLMTGTQHGAIDFEWLIANLEIGQVASGVDDQELGKLDTFVLGPKAVYAAETYVLGLFQLYPTVYFHKTTRGTEKLFSELLFRVIKLVQDGSMARTGLPRTHPIVRFAKKPELIENVLSLDDTVVWGALGLLAFAKDPIVQDLSIRLRDRKLYKCIDVRMQIKQRVQERSVEDSSVIVDRTCAAVDERVKEFVVADGSDAPRILSDEAEREPYKRFQESKGPLNQIRVKVDDGSLVDLGVRSKIVRAIEPFRLYRLYLKREDDESEELIQKAIEEEIENAAKG